MLSKNAVLALTVAALAWSLVSTMPTPNATIDLGPTDEPLDMSRFTYRAPSNTAERAPCPFLNSAANHGLLPRDGKHISADHLAELLPRVGLPKMMAGLLVKGLKSQFPKKGLDPQDFSLGQLKPARVVEHDLSLTRYDQYDEHLGHQTPEKELVDGLLGLAHQRHYKKGEEPYLNALDIAHWRQMRHDKEVSLGHTPDYNLVAQVQGTGECAMLVHILGRDGTIKESVARSILQDEKFPDNWTPTQENGFTLSARLGVAMSQCSLGYYTPTGLLTRLAGEKPWCAHLCPVETEEEEQDDDEPLML